MQSKVLLPDMFTQPEIEKFFQHLTLKAPSATLVGGAIRDLFLAPQNTPNDLDLVVANDEFVKAVSELPYELGENRHGNPRFWIQAWGDELHIDLWSPARFYAGYVGIEDMLEHFDMSVNAVGVHLLSGDVYDPVNGVEDLENNVTRLMETQWTDQDTDYAYHLVNRLNKLLDTYPTLKVLNPELAMAQIERLEKLKAEAEEKNKQAWDAAFPHLTQVKKPLKLPPVPLPPYVQKTVSEFAAFWSGTKGDEVPSDLEEDNSEVCATWLAGDRCPGCMGCPYPELD